MPELPEVRTVAYHLNKNISGLTLNKIDIKLDKLVKNISSEKFSKKMKNLKLLKVENEGKWIVFRFENDNNLIVHLRLEGKFRTKHVEGINPKHDHAIFHFNNGTKLYFNDTRQFGTFHLLGKDYKNEKPLSNMGSELDEINIDEFHKKISGRKIPIKTLLLDQNLLIGLGNIYVNEVLWWCKVNPSTPSNEISKSLLKKIINKSHEIMERAYEMGGSSIATYSSLDGIEGEYQHELKVHLRQGQKCTRCKNLIEKYKVNGRGTYWCPKCQK